MREESTSEWWVRPQGRKPPRQTVDTEKAIETAFEMIDRDGLEAFSMRKLAVELGVGAPALYWHVVGRDQLLGMVLERSFRGFELPDPSGPWRDVLVDLAHGWWTHWGSIPNLTALLDEDLPPFPTMMRMGEFVAGVLSAAGLTRKDVALSLAAWQAYLVGTVHSTYRAQQKAVRFSADVSPYVERMLHLESGQFPNLRGLALEYANVSDRVALYDFGLQSMLTGFAEAASRSSRRSRRRTTA